MELRIKKLNPSADTLQGLRTALAEEQARGRLVAAQLNKERERASGMLEELTTLRALHVRLAGEYDARKPIYQDREEQITRLTRFIYTHYLWEIKSGAHAGLKQVDIAMRYMRVERRRWRVRLRNWWYQRVKYRKLWKASTASIPVDRATQELSTRNADGGFYCHNCGLVPVDKQGSYCLGCLQHLSRLAERAR